MPDRLAVCGLLVASSVTVNVALRVPRAAGVKATLIVQLAPAATEVPQLLVWAKSPLLAPVKAMLINVSAVLWVFVRVTA